LLICITEAPVERADDGTTLGGNGRQE